MDLRTGTRQKMQLMLVVGRGCTPDQPKDNKKNMIWRGESMKFGGAMGVRSQTAYYRYDRSNKNAKRDKSGKHYTTNQRNHNKNPKTSM